MIDSHISCILLAPSFQTYDMQLFLTILISLVIVLQPPGFTTLFILSIEISTSSLLSVSQCSWRLFQHFRSKSFQFKEYDNLYKVAATDINACNKYENKYFNTPKNTQNDIYLPCLNLVKPLMIWKVIGKKG